MFKQLTYNSIEQDRKTLHLVRNGGSLIKVASADEWLPEIRKFVESMVPKDNYIYTLCNALGAGEYWSSNVNGDYFPEKALLKHHDTFLNAHPFMMHINKDPNKGYGDVMFSAFNPKMHRVELVIGYDRDKLPERYVKKIENDENVNLSMGCRVPYDVCSICGNVAPTPAQYCDCIKKYGLNHTYDDGRKLYVINTEPDFFDISIVIVPADKTARILSRINVNSKPSEVKTAAANITNAPSDLVDLLPELSFSTLQKVAVSTKTPECLLASVKNAHTYLKPHEVQAILCMQKGMSKIAKVLHANKIYFESDLSFSTKLATAFPVSLHFVPNRLRNIKKAMVDTVVDAGVLPATSYNGESLAGDKGLLAQMASIANISALIGTVMGQNVNMWLPMLLSGANITNKFVASSVAAEAPIPPQEDLMLAPLVYAKKASTDTLKTLYAAPLAAQLTTKTKSWEKVAEEVVIEGLLRLKAKKIIKDCSGA